MKVDLYHGILWSRYKARVFSEMHKASAALGLDVRFFQIAETESSRVGLAKVDRSVHNYPHTVLFEGGYEQIGQLRLSACVFWRILRSDASLILLPGYSQLAHWSMLLAAIISGKKRAVFADSTLRDHRQSPVKGVFKRVFFRLCDGFFTYGARGNELLQYYGAPPCSIFQRVQAAALAESYSPNDALARRISARTPTKAPVFLYVGRLSREKALDTLLLAFSKVAKQHEGAELRIVGVGPQRAELKEISKALGLESKITFVGGLEAKKLEEEYLSASCLVLPSRSEPWGLVVNEALHFGCPVVVSDACGCAPELVRDGLTGYAAEPGNADDLAIHMAKAIQAFSDVRATAIACHEQIAPYTSSRSAVQTLEGCRAILGLVGSRI